MNPEDSDSSGEPGAGRFGGIDEQSHAEQSSVPDDTEELPDGSGNDLPQEESPNDDDEESFDAG
ncbi:hypothetical protein D3C78_1889100 [compost metagenome]